MLNILRQTPAVGASLLFHVALLAGFAAIKFQLLEDKPPVAVQTIFEEEREQEQFTQQLTVDTQVSENLSVVAGGIQSTNVGASSAPAVSQKKIEQSESLSDPKVLNVGMVDLPSMNLLGEAVGEGEINGEVGARAEGYGAALSRVSSELMRLMREQPVLAVWLFDASSSLADDREEISDQFDKIYKELNIAKEEANTRKQKFDSIETMICQFGDTVTPLMKEPSGDLKEIRKAIDAISEDKAGKENVFSGIIAALEQYGKAAMKTKRKLVIIVVSDESGDDGTVVEEAVARAKQSKAPVYFLGRESIFGYPYASVRLVDEKTGLPVWPRISRGPETAMPEALQWNGFGRRHGWAADNSSAGFGPYEQVRLARESGGIFFLLADVEENLSGNNSKRVYDSLAMKEYEPLLLPRKQYEEERMASKFRDTIWKVIARLNPNTDEQLNFRWRFSIDRALFQEEAKQEFDKTIRALGLLDNAIELLESVKSLRAKEASQRWRAAFDLAYAQCLAYKVRLFQNSLALDHHAKVWPDIKKEKTNQWHRHGQGKLLEPDEQQLKATGVTLEELEDARKKATVAFQYVMTQHPGTPWALRASHEKRGGYGIRFDEHYRDPRYDDPALRPVVPKL